ncbi:hypothetical protein [Embleya scabrispora]|uniref:hypothetical protein n=1 Tax=Embleya scabrispora TaxID=159449 RepID=UPI00036E014B|nr:hypothetical protein [Embleya scabrispora]MYS81576.1 hypothetical protein [Streptomyces sp. SID5474]
MPRDEDKASYFFDVVVACAHTTFGREHICAMSEALMGGDVGDAETGGGSTGAGDDSSSSTHVAVQAATTTTT